MNPQLVEQRILEVDVQINEHLSDVSAEFLSGFLCGIEQTKVQAIRIVQEEAASEYFTMHEWEAKMLRKD